MMRLAILLLLLLPLFTACSGPPSSCVGAQVHRDIAGGTLDMVRAQAAVEGLC